MKPQLFVAVAMALPLVFQARQPDFSGTWIATTDAPRSFPAAPSPVFGARFSIDVAGGSLTLTRMSRDGAFPVTMPVGGAPVRVRTPGRTCEGDAARIETVAMEGDALAYTLVGTVAPGATEPRIINVKYLMRAESPGTISVQGTMVRQGEAQAVGTVYRRSTEKMPAPAAPAPLPVKGVPATIAQAAWIGATWIGAGANNLTVEERWTPPASGAMIGVGRSLRGPQMADLEFLCIVEREGTLVYAAMPWARSPATPFVLTSVTADSVTFENPSHDYPKLIRYARLPDGSLQTTISAGGDLRAQTVVLKKR
ncbi:MAG TPA: DUF6265 family protein [Vicinamibacterales bacterium]